MFLLQIVILLCLGSIFYQDLRYRAVYWFCFPLLGIFLSLLKYNLTSLDVWFIDTVYGLSFLLVQIFLLWVYFSVKNKRLINLTNNYLGWGDILFLLVIPCYLSPVNFVLFYIISLIVVLLYTIFKSRANGFTGLQIPLAGLQALLLGLMMIIDFLLPTVALTDDSWIYPLLV